MLELRQGHALTVLLKVTGLSRSTFYYQLNAQAGERHVALKAHIRALYAQHKGRYGYRRITAALRQAGEHVNHKAVQRLMQALGLKSLVRAKKYRSYRGEQGRAAPNLLARQFEAGRPHQKWVTDVTEFKVRGEKLYLSPVMDLYNGEIVAYETSRRPVFQLVGSMLKKALARLTPTDRPLLHSDQGWQYQQPHYQRMLTDRSLTQSMSRKGNCYDNAAMESFWATLKTECFGSFIPETKEQAKIMIFDYIEGFYNRWRLHSALGCKYPLDYESPQSHKPD